MAEPMVGEIRIFAGNAVPSGWMPCRGQVIPISQAPMLYAVIANIYGGDGKTYFNLPDLQGRTPIAPGPGIKIGQVGGESTHQLTTTEMPIHRHTLQASTDNTDTATVTGNYLGTSNNSDQTWYGGPGSLTNLLPGSVGNGGAGLAHPNMQPYMPLNFCIALYGVNPPHA